MDTIHQYSELIARIRQEYGAELWGTYESETTDDITLNFRHASLEWIQESFVELAKMLMAAQFETSLLLSLHDIKIQLIIGLRKGQLLIDNCTLENIDVGSVSLPDEAVHIYEELLGLLQSTSGTKIGQILSLLSQLSRLGVEITIDLSFYLNKISLVDKLRESAPNPERIFVSCFFFPETLESTLAKSTLSYLQDQFYRTDNKTVIVVFGAEGALQGDFLSVCGNCSDDEIEFSFRAPDQEKSNEFADRLNFRSNVCNLQLPTQLLPESLRTNAHTQDKALLAVQDQLKKLEAILSILSLANQVSVTKLGQYSTRFEGQRTINFLMRKEDIKQEHIKNIIVLYTWAYENVSYDKIGIIRNVIALYVEKFDEFLKRAKEIGESARASYQFYLKTKIESYFETRRKIRELIDGFAREAASEVARLTREINENIYKTAGLVAAAVIAVLIRPENTFLILAIGGAVVVLFLLSILIFYLPTMRTQFENREKQYRDDVNLFAESLEKREIRDYIKDKTIAEQRALFLEKIDGAKKFYCGVIGFVVIALLVFFVVQQVTSA